MLSVDVNRDKRTSILTGRLDDLPDSPPKVLRIYVCSNKSDFELERTRLWRDTLPYLQHFCVQNGLDVVWADVQHGSVIDHTHNAHDFHLHMTDIEECCKASAGPFFLCLIGEKYGDCPLPLCLKETEFNFIKHGAIASGMDISVFEEWYQRDKNVLPTVYRLQPLYTCHYWKNGEDTSVKPKNERTYTQLQDVIDTGIKFTMNEGLIDLEKDDLRKRFFTSGLEKEVKRAVELRPEGCIFVERNINGITNTAQIEQFQDGDPEKQEKLDSLKAMITTSIPEKNQFEFNVNWKDNGLCPRDYDEHADYIDNFSGLVANKIKELAEEYLTSHQIQSYDGSEQLCSEALLHLEHCNALHESFFESHSQELLKTIHELLLIGSRTEHFTIMIKGHEKIGKSTLLAHVCHKARDLLGKDSILIVRFLGLKATSINSEDLLREICLQLNFMLQQHICLKTYNISKLTNYFHGLMNRISKGTRHLVIAIDNIDLIKQPHDDSSLPILDWIVCKLPPKVHMVVTYSSPVASIVERLENKASSREYKLAISNWTTYELLSLFKFKLSKHKSVITTEQEMFIVQSLNTLNSPSGASLLVDEALTWVSFNNGNYLTLPATVSDFIHQKLSSLELLFSPTLLQTFCQYITLARDGLSEMEILDLLSCNNQLLLAIFPYELPTVLRFPYHKWLDLKRHIGSLLCARVVDGKLLMTWSFAGIQTAVRKRYLTQVDVIGKAQTDLSELFMETWIDTKPIVDRNRNIQIVDDGQRFVCPQPLLYSNRRYNLRRINTLWLQLLQSGQVDIFKEHTLCDFEFLLAMAHSQSMHVLLNNFKLTIENLLDPEVLLIYNTIRMSEDILVEHPLQLANELIGRLRQIKDGYPDNLEVLVTQCMQWCDRYNKPLLVPLTTWLKCPFVQLVTTMVDVEGNGLLASVNSSQHLLCTFGMYDIALYHVPSGKITKVFTGHRGIIRCLSVAKNGRLFVSGADDGVIRVWQISGGLCIGIIREHKAAVTCLTISVQHDWIISGSEDASVMVCTMAGKKHCTLRGHKKAVTSVKLNRSNSILATASKDHTIVMWSLDDLAKLTTITDGLRAPIRCMDLSNDNTFLVVGCDDGTLNVISFTTGSWIHRLYGHEGTVQCLAVSHDCRHVVAGCSDGKVYLYNLRSTTLLEVFKGHVAPVSDVCIAKNDNFIFSAAEKVMVWNFYKDRDKIDDGEKHSGYVTCVHVSNDGKIALSGSEDGILKLWNLELSVFKENFVGHNSCITCLDLSGDHSFCITGSRDKTLIVWTISTATVFYFYRMHINEIKDVKILNDDSRILSCDTKGNFHLWDVDTGNILMEYSIPSADYIISSDSAFLITIMDDHSAKVWSTFSGKMIVSVSHSEKITCLARSHDDTYLVTGSFDRSLKVWELCTGKLTQVLVEHDSPVVCAGIHGETIVSGAQSGGVVVWDVVSGEPIHKLTGHKDVVSELKTTFDGLFVLTGSRDGTIRLWNLRKGSLVTVLDMHEAVSGFSMTGDAKRIAIRLAFNCHVPLVCLHNSPADPDSINSANSSPKHNGGQDVLPITPKMSMHRRSSVLFPVQKVPYRKRTSSESSVPQIIRLSPIRAPVKKVIRTRFRVPRITKSEKDDRRSEICAIL